MGILHRVYARHAPTIWEVETRLLHRLRRVRKPVAVQWIATKACDLKCPHCYSSAGRPAPDELTTDEVKRLLIDELVNLGSPELVIAGGELFLRKDLPEIIEYAASRGIRWSMHSHGRLVPHFRELMAKFPPVMAAISVDGPPAMHDTFRGRQGSFDDAMRAVEVLVEIGCPEVAVSTTVTRLNADHLVDLYPMVRATAAHAWGLHLFVPEGRGAAHRALLPSDDQLRRVAGFVRRKRREFNLELDNEWGGAGQDDLYYRETPFLCGAGRITCVVGVSGAVLPCTTTDLSESAGNVRERPLSELWRTGFSRFRTPGDPLCSDGRDCWLQTRNGNSCRKATFGVDDGASLPREPVVISGLGDDLEDVA